ncbi:hypothetical protein ABUW04_36070 [Streptacidiphilus sp. N1-10]|uniref:DUF5753 domain-containing protein n=1 Tax=Streptacidiphilus jeojiensis TaxID=3229225 RepID=A0ABV6XZH9_9ACTN
MTELSQERFRLSFHRGESAHSAVIVLDGPITHPSLTHCHWEGGEGRVVMLFLDDLSGLRALNRAALLGLRGEIPELPMPLG